MDEKIAVIGAGVIGSAVAFALAREGRRVVLIDRAEPGVGGASFGNAGHVAAELVQPLPSPALLFGFWRELFALDGPLEIPWRRLGAFAPWALRFARAAFRRALNTRALAPLVKPATAEFARLCAELGAPQLLRTNGHLQVWFGNGCARKAAAERADMTRLGIALDSPADEILRAVAGAAGRQSIAGLGFPDSGHVADPLEFVRALAQGAQAHGAEVLRADVRALQPAGDRIELSTDNGSTRYAGAVVCAGAWSAPLLASFGLRAPLEAAYGYHVELMPQTTHVDAPLVYMDEKVLVTPMRGRVRATSFMEFSGLDSRPDPRKPAALRRKLRALGYRCTDQDPTWRGARPVLPDYLPGMGRARAHNLYYAIGHQHIGLTLAPVTAQLIADLVAQRTPRHDIAAFDLGRFGSARMRS